MNFAYPFNQPTLAAKFALQRRFGSCRGGLAGVNSGLVDLGYLRAISLDRDVEAAAVHTWIEAAARRCGWLVFFTHDVADEPSRFGCTPALLERTLTTAVALGAEVVTVGEALARIRGSNGPAGAIEAIGEPRAR